MGTEYNYIENKRNQMKAQFNFIKTHIDEYTDDMIKQKIIAFMHYKKYDEARPIVEYLENELDFRANKL